MRTLLIDIETGPNLAYVWQHWQADVIAYDHEWFALAVAYQWYGEGKPEVLTLPDYPRWEQDQMDDRDLMLAAWELLDQADIVVAHNGDKFDLKKLNARFVYHGLTPPSPYRSVDTLKIARRHFKFQQNGLDPLSKHLGLGGKVKHEGFTLWRRCMAYPTDLPAWSRMRRYAKQDIVLLGKLYEKLRPWDNSHPNVAVESEMAACPKCGSTKLQRRGKRFTQTMTYQQFQCQDCGGWCRSRLAEREIARPEVV